MTNTRLGTGKLGPSSLRYTNNPTGAKDRADHNGAAFHKGREFAAWFGLVPKQYSTGAKAKLLGISKRRNPYLRKMLIHGARAAVLRLKRER
jgi:transposase